MLEVAVIGVPDERAGTAMIAFCVPTDHLSESVELTDALGERVAFALGKPFRPKRIVLVSDLPKTRNGKIMRRAIRAGWLGEDSGDRSALENAGTIQEIRQARAATDTKG